MAGFERDLMQLAPPRGDAAPHRARIVWITLAALVALLLWALPDVVMTVLMAALIAIVLRGAADRLASWTRLPPQLALAALTLAIVLIGGWLGYWLGPHIADQGQHLVVRLATQLDRVRAHLAQTSWGKPLASGLSLASGATQQLLGPAETALLLTFRTLADLVVLAVTALYFAISPQVYVRGLVRLVPVPHRPRALAVLQHTCTTLRRWVLGQMVDMMTVGILTVVGLSLLGVPEPYALALLAGLLTFVPYFGAIIAAVPALVVAATVGWDTALWTLGLYLVCHVVEGYVVAPVVQRRLLDLPPALSILSMTVMGALFGSPGVVLGTPVAAAGLVLVRELYLTEALGDHDPV